ncbi:hypothetical protein HA44_09885 [Mixta gaviniae]|nr:hypothetical protein HA44_09885 [Mixta gaviniae]
MTTLYQCQRAAGAFTLRPMTAADAPLIHRWVTQEYARFWGMQNDTLEQVAAFYRQLTADNPQAAVIGLCNGEPVFLMEFYQAQQDEVGKHYPARLTITGCIF